MKWLFAIAVIVGLAWFFRAEQLAESNARAFCAKVEIGAAIAEVANQARTMGDKRLRRIGADAVSVGFTGVPPFSRHLCDVRGEAGTVLSKEYVFLD